MATITKSLEDAIASDPDVLGGKPRFSGTRVPVATFLDYIEGRFSLERFLRGLFERRAKSSARRP